jgi:hypothetical protein
VTGNGGLIHVESAPACGTRVSVLLPLVPEAILKSAVAHSVAGSEPQSDFASHNFANHSLADHHVGNHDFQLARNPGVPLAKELKEKE